MPAQRTRSRLALPARLSLYTDKNGPAPSHAPELGRCWLWKLQPNARGYGYVEHGGKTFRAHRLAYQLSTGIDPGNLKVCHRCDNPLCVNPAHLFLGTQADNVRDRDAKQRTARGDRSGAALRPECIQHGESKPNAKLTADDIGNLIAAAARGTESKRAIARRFGISSTQCRRILGGKAWKHLDAVTPPTRPPTTCAAPRAPHL